MRKPALLFWTIASLGLLFGATSCSSLRAHKEAIELFNGRDLSGWNYVSADPGVKMEDVWRVQDGILVCQGQPVGAIYRDPELTNFMLIVEYRWPPGVKPSNSGVFSRIHGALKPIPQAVEVQLAHGSAGDVMGLQGRTVASGQPRFFEVKKHELAGDIAGVKKLSDQENPPGEWNQLQILARGPTYTVWMNGKLVNEVTGVEVVAGAVGLQSEGDVIQFRRVSLFRVD